jgi:predicted GTPase
VTRDRNHGGTEEFSVQIRAVVCGSDDVFEGEIRAGRTCREADVIIFVVDVEEELPQWMICCPLCVK